MYNSQMIACNILWHILLLLALGHAVDVAEYGADVSFPIHHEGLKDGPLGDRKAIYEDFMSGCRKFYGDKGDRCDVGEKERVEMSLRQAQSMVVSPNANEAMYVTAILSNEPTPELYVHWFYEDSGSIKSP